MFMYEKNVNWNEKKTRYIIKGALLGTKYYLEEKDLHELK